MVPPVSTKASQRQKVTDWSRCFTQSKDSQKRDHIYTLAWVLNWQRICLQCGKPGFDPWVGKKPWKMERLPTPVFLGFAGGWAGWESTCNVGDLGSIPGLGRSPGKGKGYPLQYFGLKNSMDCIVHGSQRVSHRWATFTFTCKTWHSLIAYIKR